MVKITRKEKKKIQDIIYNAMKQEGISGIKAKVDKFGKIKWSGSFKKI